MKRNYLLTLLCLLVAILLPNEVWAGQAYVYAYSNDENGGYVYVNTQKSAPTSFTEKVHSNSQGGFGSSGNKTFYLYYQAKDNYKFKGWYNSNTKSNALPANTYSTSNMVNGWQVQQSATGIGEQASYYVAIFATLQATVGTFDDTYVGKSSQSTLSIKHAHAKNVTIEIAGNNASEFLLSETNFVSDGAGTRNITITFAPTCALSGQETRTATLTITSDNGLDAVVINLSGKALLNGQSLSWVEPINTNILKGTTAKIEATATSRLGVTYTSDNTNVLRVDADGNITAVGEGGAIITASQAGDCKYAAANSITKNFTVSDKKTPTFWLENNPDLTEKNLMVDGTTTINITNIDAEGFNAVYDTNLLGFSLVDGVATITAKNEGTATLTLTQTETNAVFAASSVFTFHISKHTGTLALTNILGTAYKVDDAVNIVDCYTASNSEVEVQVASSNTDVIAVVEGQLKALSVGTATVTFSQEETYKWTELTASQEITITKYDLSASISQSAATWDATINNPFAISYDLNDYTVEALDPAIATYTDGAIQTYAETGTAHFVISRAEDYKYNQLAETLSINVAPKTESDIIYQDNKQYDINYGNSHTYTVSNVLPGDVLTVDFWESSGAQGGLAIYGYVNEAETEIMPNTEFSTTAKTYTFALAKAYTSIKIQGDGGGLSIVNKHCKNFTIRRNLHISADNSNVNMESTISTNATATISLDYGSLGSIFKVVSNNPKITVSPASFNVEGSGTQEITLTGDATALGTDTATITIYDQSKKTTINVTSTINRIPQTIAWQSSFENLDVFSTVRLGATASGSTEVAYSIAEGEQEKASIADNVLSFKEAGTVHVVATAAQSDIYESVSDTVSVVVSLAQPVVSVFPTVEAVVYGTALTDAMLQGGVAKYGETTVEGSFAWADERITEGLMPNTYSFNVRFTPVDATHYSTAVCAVDITVNKAQQTISWQSSFEKLNVQSEVILSATAQTTVRFAISDTAVATITGDRLRFLKAGTIDVVAIAEGSDLYEEVADTIKGIVIARIDPVVSQWPSATLTYGKTLTDVVLSGKSDIEGTFQWGESVTEEDLAAVKTAETYTYDVRFVPTEGGLFNTLYGKATITIVEATQTISWENAPMACKVGERIALEAVASSGLAVKYYVDQVGNYAMIDAERNELVALAKGAIQLCVSQAGEAGKYAAAEERWTIDIEAGNTTATEQVSANEQVMVRKVMRDGVLYILRGGMCYDINGRLIGAE